MPGFLRRLLGRSGDSDLVTRVPGDHWLKSFDSDGLLAIERATAPLAAIGIVSTQEAAVVLRSGEHIDAFVCSERIEPMVRARVTQAGLDLRTRWTEDHHVDWLMFGPAPVPQLAALANDASLEILAHAFRQLLLGMCFAYRDDAGRPVLLFFRDRAGDWGVSAADDDLMSRIREALDGVLPVRPHANEWVDLTENPFGTP